MSKNQSETIHEVAKIHREYENDFDFAVDLNEILLQILDTADRMNDLADFGFQVANILKEKGLLNIAAYEALVGEI
jgi:hypothetical protein